MGWKRKTIEDSNIITLESQSTDKYRLLKDVSLGVYFIRREKDLKTILIGDNDESEPYILYGLGDEDLKEDIEQLFVKQAKKEAEELRKKKEQSK